jgi:hypothetical protein
MFAHLLFLVACYSMQMVSTASTYIMDSQIRLHLHNAYCKPPNTFAEVTRTVRDLRRRLFADV